jgi:hypothetical protein
MSEPIHAERILDAYLAPEDDRLPERVIDAVLADIARTPQRRARSVPWRFRLMPALSRTTALAAVVLVAVVGAGALIYLNSTGLGGPGGRPSPSPTPLPTTAPTPSPTPGASQVAPGITGWTTYTSAQYGLTFGYPEGWTIVRSATRDWQADDGLDPQTSSYETFVSPGVTTVVAFSVWQMQATLGMDLDSWEGLEAFAQSFCNDIGDVPCDGIPERAQPMCVERRDCHAGLLVPFTDDQFAFFGDLETDVLTVVVVWRPDVHPSTVRYGGSVELLKSILTTMDVWTPEPGQVPTRAPN